MKTERRQLGSRMTPPPGAVNTSWSARSPTASPSEREELAVSEQRSAADPVVVHALAGLETTMSEAGQPSIWTFNADRNRSLIMLWPRSTSCLKGGNRQNEP